MMGTEVPARPSSAADPCPKCGGKLSEETILWFRGREFPGLICRVCMVSWDVGDKAIKAAMAVQEES